jgi:hypothetical protein
LGSPPRPAERWRQVPHVDLVIDVAPGHEPTVAGPRQAARARIHPAAGELPKLAEAPDLNEPRGSRRDQHPAIGGEAHPVGVGWPSTRPREDPDGSDLPELKAAEAPRRQERSIG